MKFITLIKIKYIKNSYDKLLKALNELRRERDTALSYLEEQNDMVDKVDNTQESAMSSYDRQQKALAENQ